MIVRGCRYGDKAVDRMRMTRVYLVVSNIFWAFLSSPLSDCS